MRYKKATTNMEVTSIRLEGELKKHLKTLAGPGRGYQDLLRQILWDYVQRNLGEYIPDFQQSMLTGILPSQAVQELTCVFTKEVIQPGDTYYTGITIDNVFVPIAERAIEIAAEPAETT